MTTAADTLAANARADLMKTILTRGGLLVALLSVVILGSYCAGRSRGAALAAGQELQHLAAVRDSAETVRHATADRVTAALAQRDSALRLATAAQARADSAERRSVAYRAIVQTLDPTHLKIQVAASSAEPAHDTIIVVPAEIPARFAADSFTIAEKDQTLTADSVVIAADSVTIRLQGTQLAADSTIIITDQAEAKTLRSLIPRWGLKTGFAIGVALASVVVYLLK
jgi:hypothetical protein